VPANLCETLEGLHEKEGSEFKHSMVMVGKVRNARKRYVCDHLLTLGKRLHEMERLFKKRMVPVIRDMFVRFYSYREHWSNAVNCIAELDALCSLASYAR
jgi:DNA mismatch repair ATPase MutS